MRGRWIAALVAVGCAVVASSARAQSVAGASYAGTHAGGGSVQFTVAANGLRVVFYRVADVAGDTCTFLAQGDAEEWEGAAIVNNSFEYRLHDAVLFGGGFPGAQTAGGTIRLFNREVPGVKPACDTGDVAWTATTATAPVSAPLPAPAAGGEVAARTVTTFRSSVSLRRRGRTRLAGRIGSLSPACRARRRVALVRGSRTIRSARAKPGGTFAFKRTAKVRGRRVRARVATRTVSGVVCAAAASKAVRG